METAFSQQEEASEAKKYFKLYLRRSREDFPKRMYVENMKRVDKKKYLHLCRMFMRKLRIEPRGGWLNGNINIWKLTTQTRVSYFALVKKDDTEGLVVAHRTRWGFNVRRHKDSFYPLHELNDVINDENRVELGEDDDSEPSLGSDSGLELLNEDTELTRVQGIYNNIKGGLFETQIHGVQNEQRKGKVRNKLIEMGCNIDEDCFVYKVKGKGYTHYLCVDKDDDNILYLLRVKRAESEDSNESQKCILSCYKLNAQKRTKTLLNDTNSQDQPGAVHDGNVSDESDLSESLQKTVDVDNIEITVQEEDTQEEGEFDGIADTLDVITRDVGDVDSIRSSDTKTCYRSVGKSNVPEGQQESELLSTEVENSDIDGGDDSANAEGESLDPSNSGGDLSAENSSGSSEAPPTSETVSSPSHTAVSQVPDAIGFDNWTVCTSQADVDKLTEDDIAAFGTIKQPAKNPKSTKLSDMCDSAEEFESNEVTIPKQVRSVIVGKLKGSQTTFKFKAGKADTVKIVDSSKRKKVVVKIAVATLTLPPDIETTLVIDGGSIQNLECDPTKVFIGEGGNRKSLSKLFEENSDKSSVNLGNGITLKKANDTNKNFSFIIQKSGGRG